MQRRRASAKRPGSGRTNEVGEDIAKPLRVPVTLHDSVKSLIKLHRGVKRGKQSCPQIYAAVAMLSVYEVFQDKLDSLPTWSAESYAIKKYMQRIVSSLIAFSDSDEAPEELEAIIHRYEELLEKVEYSFSEVSLYKILKENLSFIEETEALLKKNKILSR